MTDIQVQSVPALLEEAGLWSTLDWQAMDRVFNSEEDIQPMLLEDEQEDEERNLE